MARFFFHLAMPGNFEVDAEGSEFADVDEAYLDAYRAALEISIDLLRRRSSPARFRFEICDQDGKLILELPFEEVMRPAARLGRLPKPRDHDVLIQQRSERNAALRADVSAQFVEAFAQIRTARTKLGLPVDGVRHVDVIK